MTPRIQIIIGIVLLLAFIGIVRQVRKNALSLRLALPWLVLVIGMAVIDIWPGIASWFATLVGIAVPLNLLLTAGIIFCLLLIFSLTKKISKLSDETKRLTQEVALLKERMDKGEK